MKSKRLLSLLLLLILVFSVQPAVQADDRPATPCAKKTIDQVLGITRDDVLRVLTAHEQDDYYLGTPFWSPLTPWNTSWCSRPNGRYAGNTPQMNCAGFVSHVFRKAGVTKASLRQMVSWVQQNSDYMEDGSYINATYWYMFATCHPDIKCYHFETVREALNSGLLRKGDLIYFHPRPYVQDLGYDMYGNDCDNHIGFFWGDTPKENRFWHSAPSYISGLPDSSRLKDGNQISKLVPCSDSSVYVFPLSDVLEAPEIKSVQGSATGITLRWKPVSGAKSYRIYRKAKGGDWQAIKTVKKGLPLTFTDKKADVGVTYTYAIEARAGKRVSERSQSSRTKICAELTMVSTSSKGNRLRWKKTPGATGYRILRRTDDSGWVTIPVLKKN